MLVIKTSIALILSIPFSVLINQLSPMEVTGILLLGLLVVKIDDRKRFQGGLENG